MSARYESAEGIALITIDRPEQLNALNPAAVSDLAQAWLRFAQSDDRVAVLTGAGEKAFCVGADLKEMPQDVWRALPNLAVPCDKPVIAAVSGYVVGAGASLALYADMVVAAESARFIYPEAKIGVFQGIMGGFPKKMPYSVGLEWATTGEPMSAQRAYEIGFVNRLAADGQHLEEAMGLARKIAANAPLVVGALKRLALQTLPRSPMDDFYPTKHIFDTIGNSADMLEGVKAFQEKRTPDFKGC